MGLGDCRQRQRPDESHRGFLVLDLKRITPETGEILLRLSVGW
jgi:hypothetical protein